MPWPPDSLAAATASLHAQVRLARIWLPVVIVGVVLLHQLVVVPAAPDVVRFWVQLLFYAILGPVVTFVVLDRISEALLEREKAQHELQRLYGELRDSYAVLGALQRIAERFAAAPDLETAVQAAAAGVREATGARAAAVVLGQRVLAVDAAAGFRAEQVAAHALAVDRAEAGAGDAPRWSGSESVLAVPMAWGGRHEGVLWACYDAAPDAQQQETLAIVAADFAASAEAVQGRTRDLLTLFEVDRSIRAEGNLARLLDSLLTRMAARAGATGAGVFLRDEEGVLELRAAVGDAGRAALAAPTPPLRAGAGPVGRAVDERESVVMHALDDEGRRAGGPLFAGAGSATLLPLVVGEPTAGALGVVVLTHPEPARFEEASLPFLTLLANQVALAVRNADAYLQAEEVAIAEERARIAREIHDGVAQSLAFAALKLDLVSRLYDKDPVKADAELRRAKETIREMIREVRRSIFALRPVDLERYGLVETLRRYAVDFGQQNDVAVQVELPRLEELSMKSESVLFRTFQEAMNNVAKHARARSVRVALNADDADAVVLSVDDDGVGFAPDEVSDRVTSAGGLGLRQMAERVAKRGGRLDVVSEPGHGTKVRVRVPR
ncbi:MAG: histidine kinase [Trueperaceae bacterium]